jgi:hypothetical protein
MVQGFGFSMKIRGFTVAVVGHHYLMKDQNVEPERGE